MAAETQVSSPLQPSAESAAGYPARNIRNKGGRPGQRTSVYSLRSSCTRLVSCLPSGSATSVYWLPSSRTTRKLPPESILRRCRIPFMPASGTAIAAARTEPPNSASPPATYPSTIMTTAASRATGTAATSNSASSVTAIMALADLSGVRSAYQPVITLTSQGPEPVNGPRLPKQHDMSCPLWVNAPLDQNHPATVRRTDGERTPPRHAA